ncbi:MAG: addiction module protein [Flavobacteriales bacterium]|nr:addiction module protein [Flavobacteriales bacterium]
MKEVTVKIPDKRFGFFVELIKQLGLEVTEQPDIPEEHKAIVRERMKKSAQNPDRLLDWDKVKDDFRLD